MTQAVVDRVSALPRAVVILLGTAAATVTVAGMHGLSRILGPALLALVITVAAHPLRGWLTKRHVPSWAATLIMIVLSMFFDRTSPP